MGKRLVRWFTYNLTFALLPLGMAVLLHGLASKLTTETIANSPEILFFTLMISATAMGDLSEVPKPPSRAITFDILRSALFLGALFSAILYGSFLHDSMVDPGSADFRMQLLKLAAWLAGIFAMLTTLAEVWIGKIESEL